MITAMALSATAAATADPPSAVTWADAMSAISTLVAAAFAIIAVAVSGWVAWREWDRMRETRTREATERAAAVERDARAQAERVTAWCQREKHQVSLMGWTNSIDGAGAYVLNSSNDPVYEVGIPWTESPPTVIGFLGPGAQVRVEGPIYDRSSVPLKVIFKDARGQWWLRDDEGDLRRTDPAPWSGTGVGVVEIGDDPQPDEEPYGYLR